MSQILKDYSGKEIKNGNVALSLKDACCMVLINPSEDDKKLDWKKKLEIESLAKEIFEGKDDLSAHEISTLKERSSNFYQMVSGPFCRAIEGK